MKEPSSGAPIDRVDGRAKVTGKASYSAEIPAANLAYAVIVGSPVSKGRLLGMETRVAESMPGVLAVLTPANAPRLPAAQKKDNQSTRVVQLLQDDAILYDGQPIALVVANTLEQAQDAAARLAPKVEKAEAQIDLHGAMATEFVPKPSGPRPPPDSSRGDFDGAFAAAPVRVEQTYKTPWHTHNPMEMHATTAFWQGDDHLTLYDATQWVFGVQRRGAEVLGIPRENVRVVTRFVGGAFGSKGTPWSHVFLAAMAAKATRRAVKLVLTRQQMFHFVGYRPETEQKVSLGAKKDGALVAVGHQVLSQTSSFDEFMEPSAYMTRMLYACPNVKTSHRLVRLDTQTPTFTRAPGEATGSFALESALDELSYALAMDPLALRLRNYAETDDDERKPYSSKSLRACYTQAAERFGWARRERAAGKLREGPLRVGWGMATATYPARQMPSSAMARLLADGSLLVQAGTMDIGTGTYTVMSQVAADVLGIPVERVRFELGDTELPEAPIEAGSSTASSVGSAVKLAALGVRDKLIQLAVADARSPLHGLAPDAVGSAEGRLFAKSDRARGETYLAVMQRSGQPSLEAKVDAKEKETRKHYSCHAFGAHFVEVTVDEDLGQVRVRRAVSAFATGRVLNPKTARSQLLGGMVWGIGLALEERTVRDERTGRVMTRDLEKYHVPVNADVPDLDVIMVPEEDLYVNEIGAKGMGEIGIVGMAAAIANAVYHATGKRIRELPITVDKLL